MGNDGLLLVNFGALQQASADIQKAVSTMQHQLEDLERMAKPLVETWQGEAQQAYAARQAKWRASSHDLAQILQNIKGAVDQSTQDYISTEKQATQRFQ
ncbi:WXG100 family type VII secretion target [Actinoplanes sp. KI2]|uniref:WXG100 family type VII secretion target n=1 Tax=Actinoplanes sp. KI2 TaxID=2983315 RepID=UPI0021D56AC2|nr:WXG100 family type VII secretion target [Actinoplanes sp. KI2]MCU7724136.1 WXG100 family type VII secretion target [Actinoplanes sp. KI2]